MKATLVILALALILPACQQTGDEIPDGAIKVEDGLYMIPLDEPVEGCRAYRSFAPGGMTASVIYYQAEDGSFTAERTEAQCD